MSALMVPPRCIPTDYINPFLPWAWAATVCMLFLIAEALTLGSVAVGLARLGRGRAIRWLLIGSLIVLLVAIAVAGAFVAWSWGWSTHFLPWCALNFQQLKQQHNAAELVAPWGRALLNGTIALLLLGAPLVLVAEVAKRRRARDPAMAMETQVE